MSGEAEHDHGRHATGAAGTSSEATAAAHLPARVRQGGAAVRRRAGRLSPLPAAHDRTGVAGPRTPGHRTPHPASEVPGGQDHGQLRLPCHPIAQQGAGAGAGALRVSPRRENVLLLGNSGTGKTHIALALGLAACQHGHRVRFTTAAALVSELIEARDEKRCCASRSRSPATNC